MKGSKVSVVITVRNEEKTIGKLIDSLIAQTRKPSEIVIVDGGSTDATASVITNHKSQITNKQIQVRLLVKPGTTIAQGRNIAIREATNEIIAMTDAGCIAKEDWLGKITAPFVKSDVNLVAGFYHMTGGLPIQNAVVPFLGIPPKRFNPKTFLPSARSMAFRKNLWERLGGFSEKLDRAGEDTFFNYQAVKLGSKIIRVEDAIVYWETPKTLTEALKKFYYYAKGDAKTGIWWHPSKRFSTHNIKIASVFARYCFGLIVLIFSFFFPQLLYVLFGGFIAYLVWAVWKARDVVADIKARMWLPVIQISSDVAVMVGFLHGHIMRR